MRTFVWGKPATDHRQSRPVATETLPVQSASTVATCSPARAGLPPIPDTITNTGEMS